MGIEAFGTGGAVIAELCCGAPARVAGGIGVAPAGALPQGKRGVAAPLALREPQGERDGVSSPRADDMAFDGETGPMAYSFLVRKADEGLRQAPARIDPWGEGGSGDRPNGRGNSGQMDQELCCWGPMAGGRR
jgi:hypothetical protein